MAKIHEEVLVVKLSKLVKNVDAADDIAGGEIMAALEQVVQELVGGDIIVEVEKA